MVFTRSLLASVDKECLTAKSKNAECYLLEFEVLLAIVAAVIVHTFSHLKLAQWLLGGRLYISLKVSLHVQQL